MFSFIDCPSEYQAGDVLTKSQVNNKVWKRNLRLIGHFRVEELEQLGASKAFTSVLKLDPKQLCHKLSHDPCSKGIQDAEKQGGRTKQNNKIMQLHAKARQLESQIANKDFSQYRADGHVAEHPHEQGIHRTLVHYCCEQDALLNKEIP